MSVLFQGVRIFVIERIFQCLIDGGVDVFSCWVTVGFIWNWIIKVSTLFFGIIIMRFLFTFLFSPVSFDGSCTN